LHVEFYQAVHVRQPLRLLAMQEVRPMPANSPATTRRRLRAEFRRMREAAGLAQSEVAQKLDWSQSKLIRIENGSVGISVTDARALLSTYGAPDGSGDDLIELARSSRVRTWWSRYREVLSPQHQEFIGFEADAARLRQYHPSIVPGLLQTAAYIRALLPVLVLTPLPQATLDSLLEVRLRRQSEVLGGANPPNFTVVLDEAVLRRPVGGAQAMREQVAHLAKMQSHETVSIAVLPFSAGPHIGMAGAFQIMEFDDDVDASILYLENVQGDLALRDGPEFVVRYGEQFDHMLDLSLRDDAAVDYLLKVARELA
jgi:transcriptional regulator with XRE-family HTH domain